MQFSEHHERYSCLLQHAGNFLSFQSLNTALLYNNTVQPFSEGCLDSVEWNGGMEVFFIHFVCTIGGSVFSLPVVFSMI